MYDYYEILGVSYTASKEEIQTAYRIKIKEYHPDTHPGDEYALEMTQLINAAYNTLRDRVKRAEYDDLLKLHAQQEAQPYDVKERATEPEVPHYRCESCGRQDETLRVSVFLYVISLLIVTYKKPTVKVLCSRCRIKYSVFANIPTFLLGWWGFPFGIIYTMEALFKNMLGGSQPPENNNYLLQALAYDLYTQGRYSEAYATLKSSQKIKHDKKLDEFTAFLKTYISPNRTKQSIWNRVGHLNPIFVSGPVTLSCFVLTVYFLLTYGGFENMSKDHSVESKVITLFAGTERYKTTIDHYFSVMTDSFESVAKDSDFARLRDFYLDNLKLFSEADSACVIFLNKYRELETLVDSKEDIDFANSVYDFYKTLKREIYFEMSMANLLKTNDSRYLLDTNKYDLFNNLWDSIYVFRLEVDKYVERLRERKP